MKSLSNFFMHGALGLSPLTLLNSYYNSKGLKMEVVQKASKKVVILVHSNDKFNVMKEVLVNNCVGIKCCVSFVKIDVTPSNIIIKNDATSVSISLKFDLETLLKGYNASRCYKRLEKEVMRVGELTLNLMG